MSNYYEERRERRCNKLRRTQGLVFGLCEGFGRWLGLAPWIFRVGLIILMFTFGFFKTVALYILASILIPSDY